VLERNNYPWVRVSKVHPDGQGTWPLNPAPYTNIPLAVVSDAPPSTFSSFDRVIRVRSEYGGGVGQKLHLDLYSPFEETLFIDSDCLVYRHPSELWSFYRQADGFGVAAWKFLEGDDEYGFLEDTGDTLRQLGIERMPHFNGGMYYFNSSAGASVFEKARHLYENREGLGFTSFRNAPVNDEPVIGLAMELQGVPFNVEIQESYVYQRELYRLELEGTIAADMKAEVAATAKRAYFVASQKWNRVRNRVREKGAIGVIPGRVLRHMGALE